jgi:tetratricopeptide (TPR) repeat protein/DNA-binding winged helix-turn-helix (wHTH) protein
MLLASRSLLFDNFRFNVPTRELLRVGNEGPGTPISLGSRAADLLLLFLDRPGELVTKSEIMDAVWPNAVVEDSNLTVQISALRRALDAGRSGASAIQTVPGRGYRFTLQVAGNDEGATSLPVSTSGALVPGPIEPLSDAEGAMPEPVPAASLPQAVAAAPALARGGMGRMVKWALLGAAAVVAFMSAAAAVIQWRGFSTDQSIERVAVRPSERPAPPRLSIVVLPFSNSSGEAKNDELAAALAEDVTIGLAQIGGSFVVARSMAQEISTRKLPLPKIGGELGVRYVLEGNIRRSANGVELKVQLSDAVSGTGVWAGQFQGSAGEPGELSAQITQNLMFPLTTAFMDAEVRRLANLPAAALTADDLLLEVRASDNHQPIAPARNAENIASLERALALEPMSADIMINLAAEIIRSILDYDDPENREERVLRVHSLADRARALAGGSESMLRLQARILRGDGRYDEAIAAFTALIQAHPTTITYYQGLALSLMAIGRSEEALPLLQESVKLDRGTASRHDLYGNLGHALIRLGRNDEAITWLRDAREHSSGFSPRINRWLAIAYANSGNTQAARREFQEFARQVTTSTVRNLRHNVWANAAIAEEMKREIDGLVIAGMRDHVDEDADAGLPVTAGLRSSNLHAPTPLGAPGISTIRTAELNTLIGRQGGEADDAPLVLSTVSSCCIDIAFPGAVPLPTAFLRVPMDAGELRSLKTWVDGLLGANSTRRLITVSWNAEWWQARNLAIELANLGYPNVSWYRGGVEAWDVAGLPVTPNSIRKIADYDEAIRRDPKSAAAFYNRGDAYQGARDFDRAIADYSEAIRLDPKLARAYWNRGRAYGSKRDQDRAIADYDEAIGLDPRLAIAFNSRGFAYQAKGDIDHAISDYDEAVRLSPKFVFAFNNRGNAYRLKGNEDRAIADYGEAIRLNPKLVVAFEGRGAAYLAKGDLDHAIADYSEAIRLAPKLTDAYFSRGRAYLYGGSLTRAQDEFKQATELNPKFAYLALWLDIAERRGGLPSHLEQAAKQFDMTAWPAPVVRLLLGELTPAKTLAAADDNDPARKQNQVCEVNFYAAELALLQNAKAEALRLFRLADDSCPKYFIEREGARAELRALGAAAP